MFAFYRGKLYLDKIDLKSICFHKFIICIWLFKSFIEKYLLNIQPYTVTSHSLSVTNLVFTNNEENHRLHYQNTEWHSVFGRDFFQSDEVQNHIFLLLFSFEIIHMPRNSCLKCTIQWFLKIKFTELCNYHHNLFQNIFNTSKRNPVSVSSESPVNY